MRKHLLRILSLSVVVLLALASCGRRQHLEVDKSLITFSFAQSTDIFSIEANCQWSIDADNTDDWVSITPRQGEGNTYITVMVEKNNTVNDRRTSFTVNSENGKIHREVVVAQQKIDIYAIVRKVWFLRTYTRWDSDFFNVVIPESYRTITYYSNPGFENWFFYFVEDSTGYLIRTFEGDTITYPYDFVYYPDYDSLNITFATTNDSIENYHTVIHELTNSVFTFSDAYRPHQFEKLYLVNVTGDERGRLKINKKHTALKPAGPIIQLE